MTAPIAITDTEGLTAAELARREVASPAGQRTTLTFHFGYDTPGAEAIDTTLVTSDQPVDYAHEIEAVRVLLTPVTGETVASAVFDIHRDSYANFPPTSGDSIVASAPPTVASAVKSEDTTLTGWATTGAAGAIYRAMPTSVTNVRRGSVSLTLRRL